MIEQSVVAERDRGLKGHWGPRTLLRLCWRLAEVVAVIGIGIVTALRHQPRTRMDRAAWMCGVCARVLRALGIEVTSEGAFPAHGVLVTNHQGYLDILALASLRPCVFVSKAEVGRWPVVGWVATTAGTVYVERGKGGSGAAASVRIREAAEDGLPVVFFPEGTTSNGEGLLPFHGGLLAESREAGLPVWVGVIRHAVRGPAGATVADDVAYWGDRGMLGHMARFLTLEGVRVHVRFAAEPVPFTTADRKAAAAEARSAMLRLGGASFREQSPPGASASGGA